MITKIKHTPGPWFYTEDENSWQLFSRFPDNKHGHPKQILKAPKQGTPYAEYWPDEADAQLIATTPDMFEALENLVRDHLVRLGEKQGDNVYVDRALAVLAKARRLERW